MLKKKKMMKRINGFNVPKDVPEDVPEDIPKIKRGSRCSRCLLGQCHHTVDTQESTVFLNANLVNDDNENIASTVQLRIRLNTYTSTLDLTRENNGIIEGKPSREYYFHSRPTPDALPSLIHGQAQSSLVINSLFKSLRQVSKYKTVMVFTSGNKRSKAIKKAQSSLVINSLFKSLRQVSKYKTVMVFTSGNKRSSQAQSSFVINSLFKSLRQVSKYKTVMVFTSGNKRSNGQIEDKCKNVKIEFSGQPFSNVVNLPIFYSAPDTCRRFHFIYDYKLLPLIMNRTILKELNNFNRGNLIGLVCYMLKLNSLLCGGGGDDDDDDDQEI
ncbi:hypothetical protein H8356DRAFT_1428470 [Neocallimastix lanati (nom. inval.)]|nr:hypothetical protein H8356DRAFT_1428470 [Neocallimastix sp. JGI-2020a]